MHVALAVITGSLHEPTATGAETSRAPSMLLLTNRFRFLTKEGEDRIRTITVPEEFE